VNPRYRSGKGFVTGLQTLLTSALVASCALRLRLAERLDPRVSLPLICTLVLWLVPLLMGGNSLSLYRSEALLLPAVFLFPSFDKRLQYLLLSAAVALSIPMAALFFKGVLV
jgi:hypothetical protein